jgi:hypothetical protein
MALQTKTISSSQTSNGYTLKIVLTENSTSTTNNTSSVSYVLQMTSTGWNFSTFHVGWTIKLNGVTVSSKSQSSSPQISLDKYSTVTIVSGTATVEHDDDGSLKMAVSASTYMAKESYTPGDMSLSGVMTLTTIPRGSKLGTISSFILEDSFSVPYTKYSSSFTDNLTIKIGSTTIATISNYTSNATINLTPAQILTAYGVMTSQSQSFTFTLTTKSGTTTIGTNSKTATGSWNGTARLKTSSGWVRGRPWIKINGTWQPAIIFTKASSVWNRGE